MKVIFEFQLPEDQQEYEYVVDAEKMYSALISIKQIVRTKVKHNPDDLTDIELKQWEVIQDGIFSITSACPG